MKKTKAEGNMKLIWPDQALLMLIAISIIWDWKLGIISFLALGLIYTIGRGK